MSQTHPHARHDDAAPNPSPEPPGSPPDGRTARVAKKRRQILQALEVCLADGLRSPRTAEIADRAGVSQRSVFRIFENRENLFLEYDIRQHTRLAVQFRECPLEASVEERARSFLSNCALLYEGTTPIRRVLARYSEDGVAGLGAYRTRQRHAARAKIQTVFAPELQRMGFAESRHAIQRVLTLTSWTVWEELRRHERTPVDRAVEILIQLVMRTLKNEEA